MDGNIAAVLTLRSVGWGFSRHTLSKRRNRMTLNSNERHGDISVHLRQSLKDGASKSSGNQWETLIGPQNEQC